MISKARNLRKFYLVKQEFIENSAHRSIFDPQNGLIRTLYKDFEELCFTLSRHDKYEPHDYENMDVYRFLRNKELLMQYLEKKRPSKQKEQ